MPEEYESFENAEEVWFWFCNIINLSSRGLRAKADFPGKIRPCEVGDIYMIIKKMHRFSHLSNRHLRVMSKWGQYQTPPYYDKRAKRSEIRLWEEGMMCFESYLKQQNILG